MKITINIDAKTNKVSVSKGADASILYAVLTQYYEQSYLEGIFVSLEDAKKCQKKAIIENKKYYVGNASTTIWRQYLGKCMPMKNDY